MNSTNLNINFPMGTRFGDHPDDGRYPGRLIIVEGIDGSGKSTQIDLLGKWLSSMGYVTVFTEWNSSPIVRRTTKRGKDQRLLTPMSFSLIHAADFAKFRVGIDEYLARYFIGHYNPLGNFFCAFAMKDALIKMLAPAPPAYRHD